MFLNDKEFSIAYRDSKRWVSRFVAIKPTLLTKQLPIPKCKRFNLVLPDSKAIEDLRFAPTPNLLLQENHVEVAIRTYSLNFRDVLVVLKPSEYFENINAIGCDFSGIVVGVGPQCSKWKEGDAVFGMSIYNETLASSLSVHEDFLIKLPDKMTFEEGSTLPAVAATVYACLVKTANLHKRDTVLIHTASGGVGLMAIQLAKHIGCRIVATAGNKRKRAYLRKLGVEFVYNSRSTEYLAAIRREVGGVDVVLNSLTGPGFKEASLDACKPGARFVEMSKLNIWSAEEVMKLREDVIYSVVDISDPTKEEAMDYLNGVENLSSKNVFQPLPYVRFEAGDIREALTFMQKAKHIGKIICGMPHPDGTSGGWVSKRFNDRSTYLITGGLGGIGWETCKWMLKNGAKYIVLTGRNPPSATFTNKIELLNAKGANVTFLQCDVGDFDKCSELLRTIESLGLPQLRGVMHVAGVLSDGSYDNQTWDKFQETFRPKVDGSLNLHQLTINYPLEHFVFFSSVAGCFGSLGQSNHCAANTFMDNLACLRQSMGLPATTINWGQWGQVGVAANKEIPGIKPMTTLQCFSAMDACLRLNRLQTAISEIDINLLRQSLVSTKIYMQELTVKARGNHASLVFDSVEFWKNFDEAENFDQKNDRIKLFLKTIIKDVLRLPEGEIIEDDEKFLEIGMDSLMMIEMKNQIQTMLGERAQFSNSAVKDCTNVNELSRKLVDLLSNKNEGNTEEGLLREELIQLLREDSKLPQEIQILPGTEKECLPSKIKTVFVTGTTGNLGPFILRELVTRNQLARIICLVRPHAKLSGRARLEKMVKAKRLEKEINVNLLEVMEGDVTKDLFGMTVDEYKELALNVDAVFNLSAKIDIQGLYCTEEIGKNNARSVNVIGTLNILKFAVHKKVKHVFQASTILTSNSVDEAHFIREGWPQINEFDEFPDNAYVLSKFVSDILVGEGVKRGIPGKVFRLPILIGESADIEETNIVGNTALFAMLAFMRLGIMPENKILFTVLPIRQATKIASKIFFDDACDYEMYNIVNPFACDDTAASEIAEGFGYPVKVLPIEECLENINSREDSAEILDIVQTTTNRSELMNSFRTSTPILLDSFEKNKKVYWSKKLENLVPNYPKCFETSQELLKKELLCAKNFGIFSRFGLKGIEG